MIRLGLIAFLAVYAMEVAGTNEIDENCKAKWMAGGFAEEQGASAISRWASESSGCSKSALYHYYLGWLYKSSGDAIAALDNFYEASNYDSAYKQEVDLIIAQTYFQALLGTQTNESLSIIEAKRLFSDYVSRYPNDAEGFAHYSGILLLESEWKKVTDLALKSLSLSENAYAYRNLAIASHQLGKYENSLNAFRGAYLIDENTVRDADLMLCGARSFAFTGNFKMARALLRQLEAQVPAATEEPMFGPTSDLIEQLAAQDEE